MPKEKINYAHVPTSNEPQHMEPEFSIHWGGSQQPYVQIGLEADIAWLKEIANGEWGGDSRGGLFSPVLNRDEINRAIRALRRARDASYGKDA